VVAEDIVLAQRGRLRAGMAARSERLWPFAPLAVGAVSLGFGLIRLSGLPRSYDERMTVGTASRSVGGIWRAARATEAPHLIYYLLMKPWLAAFGTGLFVIRVPSVVCVALAAVVLTALGTRLFGREGGLIAGLTLASAAFVVQFSQWARGYAPALFLAVLCTYAFVRAFKEPQARWLLVWACALVAACWMNLFSISVLAAQVAAYLMATNHPRSRLAVGLLALVVAAVAPIVVLVATADNGQLAWIPAPTPSRIVVQTWDWASRNPFVLLAAVVGIAALVAGRQYALSRWKAALVIVWTVAPLVVTLVLSAIQPAFDAHYLLIGAAGLALLVAAGVVAMPRRASLVLLGFVVAGAGLQLAHYYVAPGRPFSSLF
jgi:mannosyltransferase